LPTRLPASPPFPPSPTSLGPLLLCGTTRHVDFEPWRLNHVLRFHARFPCLRRVSSTLPSLSFSLFLFPPFPLPATPSIQHRCIQRHKVSSISPIRLAKKEKEKSEGYGNQNTETDVLHMWETFLLKYPHK
jgi:hypothetical protein